MPSDFTDQCIPQDDAEYWYRVQLQECDGCRGGHYELRRHKDGRWLCADCSDCGIPTKKADPSP